MLCKILLISDRKKIEGLRTLDVRQININTSILKATSMGSITKMGAKSEKKILSKLQKKRMVWKHEAKHREMTRMK